MSNLTEINYADGDVVWVRLSSFWWPGEVCGPSRLPDGLLESMKKKPLAVVRFFQEDTFEYVKNTDSICLYNSSRKEQFIKKGLDAFRAKKKIAEKFPEDVATAEKMTNGNPDIINDPEFQPKKRESWNDLFADPKKKKSPGAIRHHRTSDHEVRILEQKTPTASASSMSTYKCNVCQFSTNRMNVFILHNKTHTKEELTSPKKVTQVTLKPKATPKTLNQTLRDVKKTPIIDESDEEDELFETPKTRKKKPRKTPAKAATKKAAAVVVDEPAQPNTEIKSSLLADWSDDEAPVEPKTFEEPVVVPPPVEIPKPESPIKCRNIPKKRNDFTFDDLKEDEVITVKKEEEPLKLDAGIEEEDLEKLLDEVGGEGNRSETPRSTRRNKKHVAEPRSTRKTTKKEDELEKAANKETAELQAELEKVEPEEVAEPRSRRSARKGKEEIVVIPREKPVPRAKRGLKKPEIVVQTTVEDKTDGTEEEKPAAASAEESIPELIIENNLLVNSEPPAEPIVEEPEKLEESKVQEEEIPVEQVEEPRGRRSSQKQKAIKYEKKPTRGRRSLKKEELVVDEIQSLPVEETKVVEETKPQLIEEVTPTAEETKVEPVVEETKAVVEEVKSVEETKTETDEEPKQEDGTAEEIPEVLPENDENEKHVKTPEKKGRKTKPVENAENVRKNEIQATTESSESTGVDSTDEKPSLRVSRRNRKTTEKVVENIEAQEELKLMRKKKSETKRERKSQDGAAHSSSKKAKVDEKFDELLSSGIEALLSETSVPTVSTELEIKTDIKLPPKERGKRQFQSNQSNKIALSNKTESELQIAEALTQLPQTAIQFSPKKSPPREIKNSQPILPKKRNIELAQTSHETLKRQKVEPKILPKKRKTEYTNEFEEFLHQRRPDEDVVSERVIPVHHHRKKEAAGAVAKIKTDEDLFDIDNMEILFTNEPIQQQSSASSSSSSEQQQQQQPRMKRTLMTTTQTIIPKSPSSPMYDVVGPKVASRPSSVGGSPIKTKEIRRLSSPTQRTIESLKQETVGTHRKTLKIITEADGRRTLVEEVHKAPHKVLRASSSSPLARHEMTPLKKLPTNAAATTTTPSTTTLPTTHVVPKGQIVQTVGGSSNKIVITSKGALITTTSLVSTTVQAPSTRSSPSKIKSPNRIQVQSQEIILPITSTSVISSPRPIETKPVMPVRKKQLIEQHQKSLEKPKMKKEVIKMSPAQLKEAERLGYVEVRGGGKVLTKAGLREFLPSLKKKEAKQRSSVEQTEQATTSDESTGFKSVRRKTESTSSVIVIDDDPPTELDSSIDDVEEVVKKPEEPTISAAATKDLQDQGQILAVPADSFGGPQNAFYLCTAGDDGNLTPINNEALYLDASNQLVPVAPIEDKVDEDGTDAEAVPNQSIILSTGDGGQIILDQQALVALASQGEMPQIITQDGQQLILPGSAQDILAALANQDCDQPILIQAQDQDILATALANTDVFHAADQLPVDISMVPTVKAHVSETNAVLTQPPIMSVAEQPTTKNNGDIQQSEMGSKNIDDSLAVIGVTAQTHVPVSLELPITVTNPAIAPKTTNPLDMNQIYPIATVAVPVSSILPPSCSAIDITPTLAIPDILTQEEPMQLQHSDDAPTFPPSIESADESPAVSTAVLTPESVDEIIPETPEANHQSDTNSSEIPLPSEPVVNSANEANDDDASHENMNNNEKELTAEADTATVADSNNTEAPMDESR